MHRVEVVEASVDELRRLIAKQNDEWQSRFAKINRTISWAMGALAALVFFAQVVLPLARTSEPKVIQIVPQIAPAAPAPSK